MVKPPPRAAFPQRPQTVTVVGDLQAKQGGEVVWCGVVGWLVVSGLVVSGLWASGWWVGEWLVGG